MNKNFIEEEIDNLEDVPDEVIENDIPELLKEFEVCTEEELSTKLYADVYTLPCVGCGEEHKYSDLVFYMGDPYCGECIKGAK